MHGQWRTMHCPLASAGHTFIFVAGLSATGSYNADSPVGPACCSTCAGAHCRAVSTWFIARPGQSVIAQCLPGQDANLACSRRSIYKLFHVRFLSCPTNVYRADQSWIFYRMPNCKKVTRIDRNGWLVLRNNLGDLGRCIRWRNDQRKKQLKLTTCQHVTVERWVFGLE